MQPLINWLCARHDQPAGEFFVSVALDTMRVPPADTVLRSHRQKLLHTKLPDLLAPAPPTTQGAYLNLLGHLVNETRQTRIDAQDRASVIKTPRTYYGPTVQRHLRLAQVATEGELTAIHHELARTDKKGMVRQIQQLHLDVLCSDQGKPHIKVPITPGLSERLHLCEWYMRSLDDLSLGVNVFMLGGTTQAEVSSLEELVASYDLAASTTGANFSEMRVIMGTKHVHIATNHANARIDLQRLEMLARLYWGNNEATRALVQFQHEYDINTSILLEYTPVSPNHTILVPGLVLRHFTAYFNLWVAKQMETDAIVRFPDGVHDIWTMLMVQSPMWEKPFPKRYITEYAAPAPSRPSQYGGTAPSLVQSAPMGPRPAAAAAERQVYHRNTYPNGNEAAFVAFRERFSAKPIKVFVLEGVAAGHPVPKNAAGQDMCVSFHVLGNCNSRCNRGGDHHNLLGGTTHTKAEDEKLLKWCGLVAPGA